MGWRWKVYGLQWAVIVLFVAILCSPMVVWFCRGDLAESYCENRKLLARPGLPGWSMSSIESFPKAFEAYFQDQFGLRRTLVKAYNRIKIWIGDSPSPKVVKGREGWLFLKGKTHSFPLRDYQNIDLFSQDSLERYTRMLEAKHQLLAQHHVKYLYFIAPNKHTIYSEMLPAYIKKVGALSSLDMVTTHLKEKTRVPFVDIKSALLAHKKRYPQRLLYDKYDTHWNDYAANLVQYRVAQKIDELIPNAIIPHFYPLDDFEQTLTRTADLANFVGLLEELAGQYQAPRLKHAICRTRVIGEIGMAPHTILCDTGTLKAVVFRDSFFNNLQPYFSRYLGHARYLWKQATLADLEYLLETDKPDIVIEEIVERTFPIDEKAYAGYGRNMNQQLFHGAARAVYDLLKADPQTMMTNSSIDALDRTCGGIKIQTTGPDPMLVLSDMPFEKGQDYIARMDIDAAQADEIQFFFLPATGTQRQFSEKMSFRYPLKKGKNEIFFLLEDRAVGRKLRIDPGDGKGLYTIHAFSIKRLEP